MNPIIIITILISVILLFILHVVDTISIKMDYRDKNKNNDNSNKKPIQETEEFKAGLNYGFSLVQISLYKMWSEQDILDFDSINNNVKNNILTLSKSPEDFNKWQSQFVEYIKNNGESSNDNM